MTPLARGAVIGVLGGGQLGRMLALAAGALGFDVHVFTPEHDSPASRVAARATVAPFEDLEAVSAFARSVDVVTYEFENVPAACAAAVEATGAALRPGSRALATAQDRAVEKAFLRACGFETAAFAPVDGLDDLATALAAVPPPCVLKTRRFGYDGKGQAWIASPDEAEAAWRAIGAAPAILEAKVDFVAEVSIVAARGGGGEIALFDLVENRHRGGVLAESLAPAHVAPDAAARLRAQAGAVLDRLDYVGVLAIETFLLADGRALANEMAPRVHNSGHWTADACFVGQFEQHVRAVAGWPLGDPGLRGTGRVRMVNLLGDPSAADWDQWTQTPTAKLHWYGKREARDGRKMGHVTFLPPT